MVATLELSRDMFGVRAIPHANLTLSPLTLAHMAIKDPQLIE